MREPSLVRVCTSVALSPVEACRWGLYWDGRRRAWGPGLLRCVLPVVRKAEGCEGPGAEPGAECELTLCTGERGAGQGAPAPGGEDECGGIRGTAPESPGGRHGHRPGPGECQQLCGAEVVPPGSVCWAPTSGVVNLRGLVSGGGVSDIPVLCCQLQPPAAHGHSGRECPGVPVPCVRSMLS